ncbi:MAG TPA: chaperone modulator CbpM [Gammaproteobacteria bacterium]|nr:chaperone modulator CbpM [Gammaproteobacteria bacterium]
MSKVYQGILLDESIRYSLIDICQCCGISAEFVIEMVEYGIFEPEGRQPEQWQFKVDDLTAAKKAIRLKHDLNLDLAGLALAMDLLSEIDELHNKLQYYKHLVDHSS